MRGWREAQDGGDICIFIVDSHCSIEKANNTVKQLSSNLKIPMIKNILPTNTVKTNCLIQNNLCT